MVQHRDRELVARMGERYELTKLWKGSGEGYARHGP